VERESLRLLLILTPWIQTGPLPNVVEHVSWSSFRRMAVWPTLARVPTFLSVAAPPLAHSSGTAGYVNCSPQSEAN